MEEEIQMPVLVNAQGERLDATWHGDPGRSRDLVILGHGVTANKDRPFLVALAEAVAARGMAVLRFSFAGNGDSEGEFAAATVSKEVEDLGAVLDALGERRIAFVGHSQGGAVGVLRASQDPRITALVSLAGMVETHGFAQRKFGDQVPDASTMWDQPDCPLSSLYMDDMRAIGSTLDRAAHVRVPWLLVHGDADTVVPIEDSVAAAARAPQAELVRLADCDHVFSAGATGAMVDVVAPWLHARLVE